MLQISVFWKWMKIFHGEKLLTDLLWDNYCLSTLRGTLCFRSVSFSPFKLPRYFIIFLSCYKNPLAEYAFLKYFLEKALTDLDILLLDKYFLFLWDFYWDFYRTATRDCFSIQSKKNLKKLKWCRGKTVENWKMV